MQALAHTADLDIRPFNTAADHAHCDALQRRVWGDTNTVSPPMTVAIQRHGGVALGAFDRRSGQMVGFVLSFLAPGKLPGAANGLSHHSHMAAVAPEWQNRGVGMALKLAQRQAVLALGVNLITWTYDPLEARNAMLNIHKLGAMCRTYHRNYYGDMADALNAGIATDRFEVEWWLDQAAARSAPDLTGQAQAETRPPLPRPASSADHTAAGAQRQVQLPRPAPPANRLEIDIPADFQLLKRNDLNHAKAWRMRTRLQFEDAFAHGYAAVDFALVRGRAYYVLER